MIVSPRLPGTLRLTIVNTISILSRLIHIAAPHDGEKTML